MRLKGWIGAGVALVAAPALAQVEPNLFVSPCGEPFRAAQGQPYPEAAWFKRADANADGAIDKAEFEADAKRFFAVLDADHDGSIEGYEVSRYEHEIAPEVISGWISSARNEAGRFGDAALIRAQYPPPEYNENYGVDATRIPQYRAIPKAMEGAAAYDFLAEPEPVAACDRDFDGRVTLKEYVAANDKRFSRLDLNGDGRLTPAELPKTVQQRAEEGRRGRRG